MTTSPRTPAQGWFIGFAIGISTGIAIGLALDTIAIGIPTGVAIGAGLGAAFSSMEKEGEEGREASPGERRWLWWLPVAGLVLFVLAVIGVSLLSV